MFRKLALAAALALPLAAFAGGGGITKLASAQTGLQSTKTVPISEYCESSYPYEGPPYYLYCGTEDAAPGGDLVNGGEGPFHDPSGLGTHWTGTAGSYSHFLCQVPSIVTGQEYLTTTSSEIDFQINPISNYVEISEWCQVQTTDHPGTNLLAYLVETGCYSQGLGDYGFSNSFGNNFFVTENATGVATLHCNFDEPYFLDGIDGDG